MASDQLNKMRVVGNRARRATDSAVPQTAANALQAEVRTQPPARSKVIPAIVFLIAAAIGGAFVAYFRINGMPA